MPDLCVMAPSLADFRRLPQPAQARWLTAYGRLLATRREGGVRHHLYDLRGFFVETWHWADDACIGLLFSFSDPAQLDGWLEGVAIDNH